MKASLSLLLERNRESTVASYTSQLPAIMKRITIVYRFTVDLSNYVFGRDENCRAIKINHKRSVSDKFVSALDGGTKGMRRPPFPHRALATFCANNVPEASRTVTRVVTQFSLAERKESVEHF